MRCEGPTTADVATPEGGALAATVALGTVMGLGTWLGFVFGVLAPFLVADLGLSDLQAGALTSVMYATGALTASGTGWLVDHLGARRAVLLVPAFVIAAHLVVAGAPSLPVLAVGAVLGGIPLAATNPGTNRLVVEGVPPHARGRAMGWKQAGVSVAGFAVGAVIPGLASQLGWRAAATVGALVAIAAVPLLVHALPRPFAASQGPAADVPDGRRVGRIATYAGIMGAVNGALGAYVVLYAVGTLGLSAQAGGAAVATFGLVAVGARVAWATLGDRLGRFAPLLRIISLSTSFGLLGLALAPGGGVGVVLAAAAVLGGTAMSWHALAMLAAVSGVSVDLVGRITGAVTRAFYGGYVVGPLTFGVLIDLGVGYRRTWGGLALLAILAAAVPHTVSDGDHGAARAGVDGRDPS